VKFLVIVRRLRNPCHASLITGTETDVTSDNSENEKHLFTRITTVYLDLSAFNTFLAPHLILSDPYVSRNLFSTSTFL